jgi:hypothetical protein
MKTRLYAHRDIASVVSRRGQAGTQPEMQRGHRSAAGLSADC